MLDRRSGHLHAFHGEHRGGLRCLGVTHTPGYGENVDARRLPDDRHRLGDYFLGEPLLREPKADFAKRSEDPARVWDGRFDQHVDIPGRTRRPHSCSAVAPTITYLARCWFRRAHTSA